MAESVRINITVPERLHERLQNVKDQINISGVCAEALAIEVELREAVKQANSSGGREAVVARLKVERKKLVDEWYHAGQQTGIEAAPEVSYAEFALLAEYHNAAGSGPVHVQALANEDLFEWAVESAENDECPESFRELYYMGLFDELYKYWQDIADEVTG